MFGYNKIKLFFIIDMRIIVIFLFKMSFSIIKSNLNDIFKKKSFRILKDLLKKAFTYLNILFIIYFIFILIKGLLNPSKKITKWS